MINYLGWGKQWPWVRTLGEVYYYGTIIGVIIVFLYLAGKRLLELGYPKKRVIIFTALSMVMSFPAGYLGSRAATMFYKPMSQWSVAFFFDQMFHGASHTYHASLIFPLIFGAIFCFFLKMRFREVFDSIYLYVPLAHVFGRSACMVAGCCWGHRVGFSLMGIDFHFQNPMPLYAMISNLLVFYLLRRLYTNIYADPWTRQRYQGSVLASYFLIYAAIRIIYEVFRKERRIAMGFTQAHYAMLVYAIFAAILFLVIWYLYKRQTSSQDQPVGAAFAAQLEIKKILSLGGLLVSYLVVIFFVFMLTRRLGFWPWPFKPVISLADAYMRILYYMPLMVVPAYSLYWLKRLGIPIRDQFRWQRFTPFFLLCLGVSAYYALDLTILGRGLDRLRPLPFWAPVVILSVMNAFAEEVMYRQTLYGMLRHLAYSRWVTIPLQAMVYAIVHFMIAGAVFGILSFLYGILLGLVADRSKSILPGMICHFIIDLGCIGMPMLKIH